MAKKVLIKVAAELNVGKDSIVKYLSQCGFEIPDKPNAKITDEMYNVLLKEYASDLAVKNKAHSMVIGVRPSKKEDPPVKKTAPVKEVPKPFSLRPTTQPDKPKEVIEPKESSKPEKATKEEPTPTVGEVSKKSTEPELIERPNVEGLKIVGKLDLNKPKPKKKEKTATQKKEAAEKKAKPATEKSSETAPTPAPSSKKEQAPQNKTPIQEETPKEAETLRGETPELRGLKILGKIDASKLGSKKSPKKKKKEDLKAKSENKKQDGKSSQKPEETQERHRRKRTTRRKVTPKAKGSLGGEAKGKTTGKQTREVKEISKKEIEDTIKATMARMQGGGKKQRQKIRRETRERLREKQEMREMELQSDKLQVTEFISVSELASLMNVSAADVITACFTLGVIVSINQRLDAEIIELVATEFGHEIEFISAEEEEEVEIDDFDDAEEDLEPRAPIVTVMGHVDHGKTSLLDYIRTASVASGEAGGITQHIGAYEVNVQGKKITFLDTPGHEAFTAMRARGAKVTDISIVIVAADDGIMPQTREAISHSQAAGVPIIFAINKIDKPGANTDKIKQELSAMNFLIEEWGGKYQSQDISAKTGENIDLLLEKILLEAEMLDLKANPNRLGVATVLEASLEKGRGYSTKVLVQNGTIKIGDPVAAGEYSGKIKALFNEHGKKVKTAGPAVPVLLLGLDGAPQAGERFKVYESDQEARQIAARRGQINREQANRATKRISLDEIGRRIALGTFKELNLIVKGDVDGSIEALSDSLLKLSQETVQVNVIHKAVGGINESDVLLASTSDAIIIGFQVRPSLNARQLAEREGVQIKTYSIIYEAIEEIKSAIEGMLEPVKEEKIVSTISVKEIYKITKVGTIAGCYVEEGKITKDTFIRIIRNGIVVYPTKAGVNGELSSLKRFKDDVKEVRAGMECGLGIKNYNDIKAGDVIEGYEIIEIKQSLA